MSTTIIDIDNKQLSKLIFTASASREIEKRKTIQHKLQASLSRPLKSRQKMSFIFETTRGFFRVESRPVGLTEKYTTLKGGHNIPIESILKVI